MRADPAALVPTVRERLDLGRESLAVERIVPAPLERLAAALEEHDRSSGRALLASSARGSVTRVPWDDRGDAVVKETRPRGAWGRLAARVRTSRARRAFEAARRLAAAGVLTPEPLAVLEGDARSLLVVRFVPGERLDRSLEAALAARDAGRVRELAVEAARLAARLHAAGGAHGDLKPQNLVVSSQGLQIIDLDAARLRCGPPSRYARARDLAALDAYGQRGEPRVPRRTRLAALEAYLALAPFEVAPSLLRRAVVARSLAKRARWRAGLA